MLSNVWFNYIFIQTLAKNTYKKLLHVAGVGFLLAHSTSQHSADKVKEIL